MAFDDIHYFSFNVQPAQRVLIVAGTREDGDPTQAALEPEAAAEKSSIPQIVKVDRMKPEEFAEKGRGRLGNMRPSSCSTWPAVGGRLGGTERLRPGRRRSARGPGRSGPWPRPTTGPSPRNSSPRSSPTRSRGRRIRPSPGRISITPSSTPTVASSTPDSRRRPCIGPGRSRPRPAARSSISAARTRCPSRSSGLSRVRRRAASSSGPSVPLLSVCVPIVE